MTDPQLFGNLRDAFPGLIEPDRVIGIDVQWNCRTHIYDLSTSSKWYLAEGLVSHNCVWAGAAHEQMVWSLTGGRQRARFTALDVLSDYSAVTGFDLKQNIPGKDNPTDNGTDMSEAAAYRRNRGVLDATTRRHKIDAYVALEVGNWDQLVVATWLMGAAGVGLQLPKSAMDQFDANKPWTVPWFKGRKIVGGHYVPSVGRDINGNLMIVSWGRTNPMTKGFYTKYSDECVAYLSLEILNEHNLSPEGYDADALRTQLRNLS